MPVIYSAFPWRVALGANTLDVSCLGCELSWVLLYGVMVLNDFYSIVALVSMSLLWCVASDI